MDQNQIVEEIKSLHGLFTKALEDKTAEIQSLGHVTAETDAKLDKMNERFDALETALQRLNVKQVEVETPESELRMKAVLDYVRQGATMDPNERKALTKASDGGFLVTPDFVQKILFQPSYLTNVRNYATVRPTTAAEVVEPRENYPSSIAVTWEDETDSATLTNPSLGAVRIPVHKERVTLQIPQETLEDTGIDLEAWLSLRIANLMAAEEDKQFTVGSGGKKPEGFMVDATVVSNATHLGSTSTFTFNGLVNTFYALDPVFQPNATWFVHNSGVSELRKLVDNYGHPIWAPQVAAGVPATLLGYPIVVNQGVPAISGGSGTAVIAVGDFKRGYMVAEHATMSVQRLNELYIANDQIGFYVRKRIGGGVTLPNAISIGILSV